jgi:hypothetical protein
LSFVLEPVELICGVLGAIIVVGAGLYLVKANGGHETEAVASS